MGLEVFEQGTLPRWALVRQKLDATEIESVESAVAAQFARADVRAAIRPGMRVALTAGSRGIDRIGEVLREAVVQLRALGAEPFVVPAMGSHGGATADGQRALIAHYGVTEEAVGCPVRASMDVVRLGEVDSGAFRDVPVWFDRIAFEEADAVVPVGRVKPHTDFHGDVESGLMKMIAIGLGKQQGASTFHGRGIGEFHHLIPAVATYTLSKVPIPFGLALVENGFGHLSLIEAVPAAQIRTREPALLEMARAKLARLPAVAAVDVLIVDEIGKDISGDGADPNVVNRDVAGVVDYAALGARPTVQRMVVRDLTDETEGNATGIGMFDFALARAVARLDPIATAMNMITAKSPQGGRVPITVDSDRQALHLALASALNLPESGARVLRIRNTKELETLLASEALLQELAALDGVEILGELAPIEFDPVGMFRDPVSAAVSR